MLDAELDPFTKNRVSFTGVRCKILGTFYEDDVDGQKVLEFGADVDNFYATSTYLVTVAHAGRRGSRVAWVRGCRRPDWSRSSAVVDRLIVRLSVALPE
ncbi:hypothetical protein [Streptomyces sp. NPDC088261]|uniref:hypothetical protein n=1 Tax=Streptomyces sp. NPDC088261 TaxID=3365851 RepID=UPI00382EE8D3